MNRLIHLYPQAWRARYEDEFLAVLEQRRFSIGDIIDVMRGALDAHLHLEAVLGRIPGMRNRQLILTIFCAYIAFVVAGLGLYGTVDDSPFVGAMRQHSALAAAWDVLAITSGATLLSVVIGGFPVARAVLRDSQNRWLLLVPAVSFVVLIPFGAAVLAAYPGTPSHSTQKAITAVGGILFLGGAIASTAAVYRAVSHITIDEQADRFVMLPAVVTSAAMIIMLIAAAAWVILARHDAPDAFNGHWGYFDTPTPLPLLTSLAIMVISALIAARAVVLRQSPQR